MYRHTKTAFVTFIAAIVFNQVPSTLAATALVRDAKVTRLSTDNELFGQCMAKLDRRNERVQCSQWVTFDCGGELDGNTKSAANAKYQVAQLAFVTQKSVLVLVDEDKKINGQCFASRIDIFYN